MKGAGSILIATLLALGMVGSALPTAFAPPPTRSAIISFTHPLTPAERADLVSEGVVGQEFHVLPMMRADLTELQLHRLSLKPYVLRVDADKPVESHLDRSKPLSRASSSYLQDFGGTGRGITVAVVDSGLDRQHPDIRDRVRASLRYVNGAWQEAGVDTDGHGTHVAGIVAGSGSQSGGLYSGIAPGVNLVGLDFSSSPSTSTAIAAFQWILDNREAMNIRVVTNSWGRTEAESHYDPEDPVVRVTDRLLLAGIVVVFSAGNTGPGPRTLSAEAQNPGVITVGATNDAGIVARFSSRGPAIGTSGGPLDFVKPDIVADGQSVMSTKSAQQVGTPSAPIINQVGAPGAETVYYTELSGTSQAAPHVAGVVALILEANPSLTPNQVRNILRESAIDLGPAGPDHDYGFGLLDARDALLLAKSAGKDDGNILIRGGAESYSSRGEISAAGTGPAGLPIAGATSQSDIVSADFPVKPGASRIAFDFSWTPTDAAFKIVLSDGSNTYGPWLINREEEGRRVISGLVEGGVAPGIWHVFGRPTLSASVQYEFEAQVELGGNPDRAGSLDDRYRLPDDRYSPLDRYIAELQYELKDAEIALKQGVEILRRDVPGPGALEFVALLSVVAIAIAKRKR